RVGTPQRIARQEPPLTHSHVAGSHSCPTKQSALVMHCTQTCRIQSQTPTGGAQYPLSLHSEQRPDAGSQCMLMPQSPSSSHGPQMPPIAQWFMSGNALHSPIEVHFSPQWWVIGSHERPAPQSADTTHS